MWVLRVGSVTAVYLLIATTPSSAQQWNWPERAENLQVLPDDFPSQRLRAVMTGFTRALGVRCSHCHVGEEGEPLSTYDFPSDDKQTKVTARTMLRMLGDINETLKTIEPSGDRVNMWCHTCHRGRPRPMTLGEELFEVYRAEGVDETLAHYRELRERFWGRGAYDFGEPSLNALGYQIMGEGDIEGAIAMFQLNVEQFPESWNVYDSLAEAYMNGGQNELAVQYYERSLEIEPENQNAVEKLKELRSGGG